MNAEMVNVPFDELKRTINVLRHAAHPYPSPHADFWDELLAKPAAQRQGKMVNQWSDDGLLWSDGEEHEMASARAEGYQTRTLYLHPTEQPDSDKYKAELYDEVWTKATSMGFMNVTMALEKLAEHSAPIAIDETGEFLKAWPEISKHGIDNGWRGVASAAWTARASLSGGKNAG